MWVRHQRLRHRYLVLCYKVAEYFGYPGWLGIAAYVIVSALLGSLRATRGK